MVHKIEINKTFISPNFGARPINQIDTIVIHYTEMQSAEDAIERLCDPDSLVSAHYVISKTGEIFQLVDDAKRAHHAGQSYWRGRSAVNDFSIGIELDNNGNEPFAEDLMHSLILLCHNLVSKYNIQQHNIVGHSDIAPLRKVDPGIFFDWKSLAQHGIGIMPDMALFKPRNINRDLESITNLLTQFGYSKDFLHSSENAVQVHLEAFTTHYLGKKFIGDLDIISFALHDMLHRITQYES